MSNSSYVVVGDLSADKSSDNYPTKTLCEDCAADHEVVVEEGPSAEPCEDCGASDDDEE